MYRRYIRRTITNAKASNDTPAILLRGVLSSPVKRAAREKKVFCPGHVSIGTEYFLSPNFYVNARLCVCTTGVHRFCLTIDRRFEISKCREMT